MKVKYLFLSLFAALAMTACSDDKDSPVSEGENAQLEGTNYVAVRIGQPGLQTKADKSKDYETGTDNEFSIKNAYFLFFDNKGEKAAQPQLTKRFDVEVKESENKDLCSTQAIMLEPIDGKLPDKMEMLVLCNVTSELESKINEILGSGSGNSIKGDIMKIAVEFSNAKRKMNSSGMTDSQVKDETFLMSNATYATDDNKDNAIVNLVEITSDNIKSTEAEAKAKPVDVYVERVVAKVNFTKQEKCNFNAGNDESNDESMNSEITVGKNTEQKLTLDVLGFWVDNDADKGRLTKDLCKVPEDKKLSGFTWNNANDHRSFWAAKFDNVNYQNKSFSEKTELKEGNGFVYALENVVQPTRKQVGKDNTWVSEPGDYARLVVATQLKNNNEAVTLYKYLGEYYLAGDGVNGIKTALVASNAFNKFYTKKEESKDSEDGKETKEGKEEGNEYTPVTVKDLEITEHVNEANGDAVTYGDSKKTLNNHEVLFTFKPIDENKKFYDSEGNDITKEIENIELVAWKWNEGKAYYFIDMLHFGEYSDYAQGEEDENGDKKTNGKNVLNGIVRNHVYKYGVNSFVGLGTPVAVGDDVKITPEDPSQGQSFMSAKINVLSWKCVKHDGMELK